MHTCRYTCIRPYTYMHVHAHLCTYMHSDSSGGLSLDKDGNGTNDVIDEVTHTHAHTQ